MEEDLDGWNSDATDEDIDGDDTNTTEWGASKLPTLTCSSPIPKMRKAFPVSFILRTPTF